MSYRLRFCARVLVGTMLASLASCTSRGRGAPAPGDAGVVLAPNQLQACADLPACEDACRRGSAADCLSAANNYSTGERAPADEARAAGLFEAACTLGSGPGCNLAGRMHEFGHGVSKDATRALSLYERACGVEYMGGCYNVAVLLERGGAVKSDAGTALSLYRRVCEAGSHAACEAAHRVEARPDL